MTTDTAHTLPETSALTAHQATHKAIVTRYRTYTEAQDAVDHLSENRFPVHVASIVGHGLTSVERVTGRMTKSRAPHSPARRPVPGSDFSSARSSRYSPPTSSC